MLTTLFTHLPIAVQVWATDTIIPTPTTTALYDDDDVTPGVVGFAVTAAFAIVVILLGLDLFRRVRRMRHREDAKAEIAAELALREATDGLNDDPPSNDDSDLEERN